VVDYAKVRDALSAVRVAHRANPQNKHNMLFLAEGFRTGDRAHFDRIVTEVVDKIFSQTRHEPYPMLADSFNVWKAFEPSEQHTLTCGYRVTDREVADVVGQGVPVPYPYRVSKAETMYTVEELVSIVGLPQRGEARTTAQLTALWATQSLNN